MKISDGESKRSYAKKNYFTVKKGKQSFRILPALGDAAESNIWYKYYDIHFGYKGADGKMFVFQSPEVRNFKTKMIEISDAAKERRNKLIGKVMEIREKLKESPENEALKAALEKTQAVIDQFNNERRYYYNAIDSDGNVGLLKLKTRERAAFEAARERLKEEEGVDPWKINGAYVTFEKSGDGQKDSTVQVSGTYLTEEINGKKVRTLRTHTVDSSLSAVLERDSFDLLNLFPRPSAEEVEAMVEDKTGEVVSAIAAKYKKTRKEDAASSDVEEAPKSTVAEIKENTKKENTKVESKRASVPAEELGPDVKVEAKPETKAPPVTTDDDIDAFIASMNIE